MRKFLNKLMVAAFGIACLAGSSLPSVFAQQYVNVSLPAFQVTINDVVIDNSVRLYPIIVYKDITYVPMTYNDSRFLGLETKWSSDSGIQVNKLSVQTAYNPNQGVSNSALESFALPEFGIQVNGKNIDNNNETYPFLTCRDITYFPLTWRYMVNELGWTSSFDSNNGLIVHSRAAITGSTPINVDGKTFSRDFGSITVIFNRSVNNQPGNLYTRENGVTKRIGNPNYIYGVSYLQGGRYGEYTAVDQVDYANRWVYTVAVDPSVSPITSKKVKINIDTNEVQLMN
jgi:hypothetical protein